jgi:hypothetical protein
MNLSASMGIILLGALLLTSCLDDPVRGPGSGSSEELRCSIPLAMLTDGGASLDAIPALTNPEFVAADDPRTEYLDEDDRVIGLIVGGLPWAVPLNVGWWHEIINLDFDAGLQVAVTHCPLTGSSLVFDRAPVGGAEFGVSGLLVQSNLILFDRRRTDTLWWEVGTPSSLWVQMMREARCGPDDGTSLPMYPSIEMTWGGWKALHPDTRVVGDDITIDLGGGRRSFPRHYDMYPYGSYELSGDLMFPHPPIDTRRFAKERTLGIPGPRGVRSESDPLAGRGALLFPFGLLREASAGPVAVVEVEGFAGPAVVFWDERVEAAMAFRPQVQGTPLTFRVESDRIMDRETDSTWRVDGLAVEGPLAGSQLPAIPEAYVAFWFAWAGFHPEGEIAVAGSGPQVTGHGGARPDS